MLLKLFFSLIKISVVKKKKVERAKYSELIISISILSGVLAHFICPNEQIELECPGLEWAIQTGTYHELQWRVTDLELTAEKQYVGYCDKTLQCAKYTNIGSFDQRIRVSSPVRGKLLVKQMKLNDRITYTCIIQRHGNKGPLVNETIVTSSKRCK